MKVDKASVLDEAIEYVKTLQLQLQLQVDLLTQMTKPLILEIISSSPNYSCFCDHKKLVMYFAKTDEADDVNWNPVVHIPYGNVACRNPPNVDAIPEPVLTGEPWNGNGNGNGAVFCPRTCPSVPGPWSQPSHLARRIPANE